MLCAGTSYTNDRAKFPPYQHLVPCDRHQHLSSNVPSNACVPLVTPLQFDRPRRMNIPTVVATVMYDSSVLSPPWNIANTNALCPHSICPLNTLPQTSRIAGIVG